MARTIEAPAAPPAREERRRRWVVSGLVGGAAAALLSALIHTFAPSVPYPPVAMSQVLVRTTPGGFDSFFIDRLGHWAQRLAVIGTCAVFVLVGLLLGWLANRLVRREPTLGRRVATAIAFIPLWLASVALYPEGSDHVSRLVYGAVMLPLILGAGAFGGWV